MWEWRSRGLLDDVDVVVATNGGLALQRRVFSLKLLTTGSELLVLLHELLDNTVSFLELALELLLVVLLPHTRPDSRLSILKSLSGLLVLRRIINVAILTILIDDLIGKILHFLVGQFTNLNIFLVTHLL